MRLREVGPGAENGERPPRSENWEATAKRPAFVNRLAQFEGVDAWARPGAMSSTFYSSV